jgi:hypothetical protein
MLSTTLLAADDGFVHGKLDLADLLFLIAAILFGVGAFIAFSVKTFYATLIAVGLCLTAIAWFVL